MAEERAKKILAVLEGAYPDARYYLHFDTPLELLVAAILSAQCRDEVVNATTAELFKRYRRAEDYAHAPLAELEEAIARIPFYRNKAKSIQAACLAFLERHAGQVPQTLEELMELPGVGRKTANAILQNAFDKVEGIVVDTHVIRLAQRLGLSQSKDPDKIEQDLMALFPRSAWKRLPWLLKAHGRAVCTAKRPNCPECTLSAICPRVGV
ncbi:MAG: endonuclease III [Candidatus Acetothermia bacterium]|jgi:endonuclease-3|nr:endonuclease III [Candidatus Acetothermia bacterium]MDH7505935.1 endonuclease III [Candidatus Acetothermia bacterium]